MRFPPKLAPGDLIAVTAPSSGVPLPLHPRLEFAIKNLKSRGFRVSEGDCLRSQHKNKSSCKESRAKELMAFFTAPEIKAVMPPWGGDLAMELLELIDFERLAQTDPKWFVGFSDLSTLHFPLTVISGWATLHGPNLMDLGAKELDATTQTIWDILESDRGVVIKQYSSEAFQREENRWGTATDAGFNLTQPTEWKRLDGGTSAISFQGRLIGGCLDTISRLAGTKFGNLPRFCEQNKNDGVILYFENAEMGPCELTRALCSLHMHGWFDNLAGVLIGRNAAPEVDDPGQQNYLDAISSSLADLTVPVLYDVDIGHIPPQLSLVNGAMATIVFAERGGSVSQHL
ncbi:MULTISPECIES: S66 peptidase family protein [unclassified Serratia (in: enterobacteria)]|uniref:S66 family peptidase n=1 Tax=unclassified Serratia (in: enterobacteria) TaxID=2647522 RepID=UPI000503DD84|nr:MULTISPECIES: S66 peptidase family protein [unclassified Serratia (in: enterobacteria)]KFK93746.1 peptidase U61 [Serratia sp. Ag2]KFK98887.1 peptidase U61 [Serratia sp. Ag1]